ncbi:MAG TPA: sulfite exporter TauE/SafE family protein, partial [Acidimicrobiales bacterium]|nr:sulfite exporter TauE/SafE family protein [Acidimicrobiales bacterium]
MSDRALFWRVVLVGAIAGFTSGLFGVGGGIVIVPTLVIIAGFEQRLAHGTSLGAIILISATGTIGYGTEGEVQWAAAAAMVAGGLVGTIAGTSLLQRVSQPKLQAGFAFLLVATAIRMLISTPDAAEVPSLSGWTALGYVVLGFTAGLLAGLMGVGGGIITVPALTVLAGFPLVVAKGTSLAVIVPSA